MPIQLAFQSERIRGMCESLVSAKRRLGKTAGLSLSARLADLRAAASPQDLVDLGLAMFSSDQSRIVIPLDEGYFIEVASNHRMVPTKSGKLDWRGVTRVKILSIERTE
ncbi:hypothetical protein [Achromobacter xylosoxidans]|uniref:hypothetical protein n=1 Tax=Alcaligenes xylosoxydans xylosoxydans TaxID=85698 RepID=UPI001EEB53C2|nr:hypothetical protein [Achromobacter xylosoxidans]